MIPIDERGIFLPARHVPAIIAGLHALSRANGGLGPDLADLYFRMRGYAEGSSGNGTPEHSEQVPRRNLTDVTRIGTTIAAQRLGTSPRNVAARCARGSIEAERVAGRWLIHPDALDDLIAHHRKESA